MVLEFLVIREQRLVDDRDPHAFAGDALLVQLAQPQPGVLAQLEDLRRVKARRELIRRGPLRAAVKIGLAEIGQRAA